MICQKLCQNSVSGWESQQHTRLWAAIILTLILWSSSVIASSSFTKSFGRVWDLICINNSSLIVYPNISQPPWLKAISAGFLNILTTKSSSTNNVKFEGVKWKRTARMETTCLKPPYFSTHSLNRLKIIGDTSKNVYTLGESNSPKRK